MVSWRIARKSRIGIIPGRRSRVAALTILIAISSVLRASAETNVHRAVDIIETVCVASKAPEDMLSTGDRLATQYGWIVDPERSGPRPGPDQTPGSKPSFIDKVWRVKEPSLEGSLTVRILGPDFPGQRYSACSVSVVGHDYEELIADTSALMAFGPAQRHDGPDRSLSTWPLSGDPKSPDDGYRLITAATRKWSNGWFTDAGFIEIKSVGGQLLGKKL
jgi:hypothetical protein